jgi:DNA modification methylase
MVDVVTILTGDCREVLKTLPDASVHCCVTSPPYWGLRDYGTATWEGGEASCSHTNHHGEQGKSGERADRTFTGSQNYYRDICAKCGARRIDAQIGLERTPEEYVASLVAVFREVRRVLRDDGTLWLNMGDSYTGYWGKKYAHKPFGEDRTPDASTTPNKDTPDWWAMGLKPKELVGIPWRVAFALQADGWWLRSDIIWSKPNPMPESVTDRPTKSHEYLFLLAKSDRYHYDAAAIAEPAQVEKEGKIIGRGKQGYAKASGANGRQPQQDNSGGYGDGKVRNKRDVWTVPTSPYKGAHFATFPPALILPCILAGCPVGGTVLDPFGGSGTTGAVASGNSRKAVVVELNPDYVKLAQDRCGMFVER